MFSLRPVVDVAGSKPVMDWKAPSTEAELPRYDGTRPPVVIKKMMVAIPEKNNAANNIA